MRLRVMLLLACVLGLASTAWADPSVRVETTSKGFPSASSVVVTVYK